MKFFGEFKPIELPLGSDVRFQIDERWTKESGPKAVLHAKIKDQDRIVPRSIASSRKSGADLIFDHDNVVAMMDGMIEALLVVRPSPSLSEAAGSALPHPSFAVPLKLPISLDAPNKVHAITQPLRVRLRYPRPLSELEGQRLKLTLESLDASKPDPAYDREDFRHLLGAGARGV